MNPSEELKKIATLRETKGKELETLALIDSIEKSAVEQNDWETIVKLNWERSLVWQHIAMNEKAKEKPNENIVADNYEKMAEYSLKADQLIQEHKLNKLQTISLRFLGQAYRLTNKLDFAQETYEKVIKLLEEQNNAQSLEIKGYLAHVLIMKGLIKEGLNMAVETFNEYETNPAAIELRKNDYYTYAVWRSGIFPRIIENLVNSGVEFDKSLVDQYLNKSEELLNKPADKVIWGDANFQSRKDEISKACTILNKYAP